MEGGMMQFVYSDGGRAAAGFKGVASDCATRAIAIVLELPYREVYYSLNEIIEQQGMKGKYSAREGVLRVSFEKYLNMKGWRWIPTMGIGTGCRVHLREEELPKGRLVVRCSKHITAVIDGVLYDTHDCSRGGNRCVYGYWQK